MKFLLVAVNAKYIHSNPAIYSLRAYAEQREPALAGQTELAEYTINHDLSMILADLYRRKPDVLGFSCYLWNRKIICSLIKEMHKLYPQLPIWLGGPEVSYEPQSVMQELPMLAGIMLGEGEETYLDLMRYYAGLSDRPLAGIKGLYLHGGATMTRELTDMSELPFYYHDLRQFENRIVYYESSRGCPFRCSYCLSSVDKRVRFRDIAKVREELQFFLDHRIPQVKFVDRTFNCSHEHALSVWRYIKEHDNGVTNFHFEIEAALLTKEELDLLRTLRPGLIQMEIGVQSANPETLREIRRFTDMDRLREAVASVRAGRNIHVHLDLIAGLPYEDYESFGRSFNEVYAMRPDQLQLGFLKVLKGSHMYDAAGEYGMAYLTDPPYEVLYTKWLSYEGIVRLKKIERMVELYYNSNQFTHILAALEMRFPNPFSMYEALAGYYEENGYYTNSPSRAYRYEVLLRFAASRDPRGEELYRELLTFDMYLRENLKARAGFMKDTAPWHGKIRRFYEAEEKEPSLLKNYVGCQAKQLRKMTHAEPFSYPVWEFGRRQENDPCGDAVRPLREGKARQDALVVFDYRERDPLTGNAKITVLFGVT